MRNPYHPAIVSRKIHSRHPCNNRRRYPPQPQLPLQHFQPQGRTDGDGAISSDELSSGLTSAGSTADSSEIFSALDKNQDGSVSLDELTASLAPPPPPPQQASSEELFSQLDADSDGSVSASELNSALQVSDSGSTSTDQASMADALNKMIANLSKQYQLDNVATVGKHLNVAT